MKKNNKTNAIALFYKRVHSPDFLRKLFVFGTLFILLILAAFLIWKRHMEGDGQAESILYISPTEEEGKPVEEFPVASLSQVQALSDRLTALESNVNQHSGVSLIPSKLVAIELLRAILEGWIPLDPLKTFLRKNAEPWAQGLLPQLDPIKESKTFLQLEALLTLSPSQLLSRWGRIKRKIKSLIRIRKLDEKGEYKEGKLEDVQKALRAHNIQNALESFEKLPPPEKAELSQWKTGAQDRLTLEIMIKKLLLELNEG